MQRLVYAGSFDPITLGHAYVIRRAQALAPEVVVLIANNPAKKPMFSVAERMEMANETFEYSLTRGSHVYVVATNLYVTEWCERGDVLVRGIRDGADLVAEQAIAAFNWNPRVEKEKGRVYYPNPLYTIWLPSDSDISSSKVKEMARTNDPQLRYSVAPSVAKRLKEKVS